MKKKHIEKDEYINHDNVYVTELQQGDAIIFSSELYHSSVVNETDISRLIISMRMTLDRPNFFNTSEYLYDYRKVTFQDSPLPEIEKISRKLSKRVPGVIPFGIGTNNENKVKASELVIKAEEDRIFVRKGLVIEGYAHEIGENIILIGYQDKYYAFNRFCPHAGADLSSGGYIDEGNLICPWHLLSIDLNGNSKCGKLKKYNVDIIKSTLVIHKK